MIVFTIRVTKSDPSDPTVALERLVRMAKANNMAPLDFDPNDYQFYCDVCDTHVLPNTKHCQRCNRCSYEFDHHCVWVSNDIGLHNYIDFVRMLGFVGCVGLLQFGLCIYTLVHIKGLEGDFQMGLMHKKSLKALTWITLVCCVIICILDAYLLTYHIYLIYNNLTTYKHIRKQQKRRKSKIIREVGKQSPDRGKDNRDS